MTDSDAQKMIDGAVSMEGLRIAWGQIWRAYDGDVPVNILRMKNARRAQLEIKAGMP